jgi:hypothetical protein
VRIVVGIIVALSLATITTSAEPRRRKVHFDNLAPAKVAQYERARREWLAWVIDHKVVDPWGGYFLQIGTTTFLTVRPFTSFAELDPPSGPQPPIDPVVQARYNERSDEGLVAPHMTEIWVRQPELDYQPAKPVNETRGVGRIVMEQVRMVASGADDYFDAWTAIHAELVAARYPIARVAYFSQYGSGRYVSLWIAPTKQAYAAAPSIDRVLEQRLGRDRATALLARWRGAVIDRQELDLIARPDLSNPEHVTPPTPPSPSPSPSRSTAASGAR